ncbi:MAG: sugar phosphate isomerase/epimerase family protein [bacterium]
MAKIPVALQLYSVREDCAKDFVGTVKTVAEMGYEGVEFAGYYGKSAGELKRILDDLGLKVAGTHIGINTLLGDELKRTIEFNSALGNKFLVVPGLPEEYRNSKAAWIKTAGIVNEVAEKIRPYGMLVGYHNHAVEFQPIRGEIPWDIFFRATDEDVVMQLDIGNAMHGGADPIEILEKYPGRAKTVHLKEFSATNDKAVLGEGDVKWGDVFKICETTGGTEWYIIEQESYAHPPIECVRLCLENLRKMRK